MYKIENEKNTYQNKYFGLSIIGYDYFLEKKVNKELDFPKKNNNININSGDKEYKSISINFRKIKYYRLQEINFLHRFKYFLLFYMIYLFFLNLTGILCESYIIVKINKSGRHKILFKGGLNDVTVSETDCRVQMPIPQRDRICYFSSIK